MRLANVSILENDLFHIIKKYMYDQDTLFIVDPIYLDTNVYTQRTIRTATKHGANFGWKEHQQLAKVLQKISGDFIYFCRITATRHRNQQGNLTDDTETLARADIEMRGRIDDLYWGHGFYFFDVSLDVGVERIITSFPFEGATPYEESESEVFENE